MPVNRFQIRILAHLAAWVFAAGIIPNLPLYAAEPPVPDFKKDIQPILAQYCYDCHGDGESKGKVAFVQYKTLDELRQNHDLWWKVLKNLRAGLMPPPKKARPDNQQVHKIEQWVKYDSFGLDRLNPDPGRVTLRRLNRSEYRNTIRDLMGIDYKAEEEFPPDDTGYGFDNIGDVLNVSPMLLEKYMQAAQNIVSQAVPTTSRQFAEATIPGLAFRKPNAEGVVPDEGRSYRSRRSRGESLPMSFYEPATVAYRHKVTQAGTYRLVFYIYIRGEFVFDPGRIKLTIKIGDKDTYVEELGWEPGKRKSIEVEQKWEPGEYPLTINIEPLTPIETKVNNLDLRISALTVRGPMEPEKWGRPKNFERFFTKDEPTDATERREYARAVLNAFATKAFRRPVDARTLDRLVTIAEGIYSLPGKSFEQGIGHAFVAVLASPRFIFRVENSQPIAPAERYPLIDEYALAS